MLVTVEKKDRVFTITMNQADIRNAVNGPTAEALASAFRQFESDNDADVAILYGAGGNFCAGANLKDFSSEDAQKANQLNIEGDGPMGPSRMQLNKPVIAAISGYAVAGGLELACWCDMRVVEESATLGVFCRRFGVPLIDGGTARLPRLIGMSRAMDLILTGREVGAEEALHIGLANRVVPDGTALETAQTLAQQIASFPQVCMQADRASAYAQWGMSESEAINNEFAGGLEVIRSGETLAGAKAFAKGKGRHGV